MNNTNNTLIQIFLKKNPGISSHIEKEMVVLDGKYRFEGISKNVVYDEPVFMRLEIPSSYPNDIPRLFIRDLPDGFSHVYLDNSCCIGSIGEVIRFLALKPKIDEFFNEFIDPFIFSVLWYRDYGTYPFGERAHGSDGLLDFYKNDLKMSYSQYLKMVEIVSLNKYKGDLPCFCGSNKKLRDCHGKYILPIIKNKTFKEYFLYESKAIINYNENQVKKCLIKRLKMMPLPNPKHMQI